MTEAKEKFYYENLHIKLSTLLAMFLESYFNFLIQKT